jgi:GT2 family glycosyltransferase
MNASIVIPSCNRIAELRALLYSCLKQTVPVEIIVVDDAANDEIQRMVLEEFAGVRYYRLGKAKGPAFQRNRGIELANNEIVFPVDDDSLFVSRKTVEQTLAEFNHARIGAVGIPYININQDQRVLQSSPCDGAIHVTHSFVGAAHAVRRDVFLHLGGFREHFFYMGEESDLCLRMLSAGYVTRLGNADPIHHVESPRRNMSRASFSGRRNDIRFAWHNVPLPEFPLHLAGTTFNGFKAAFTQGWFRSMVSGTAAGYADLFRRWHERQPVPRDTYRLHRALKKRSRRLEEIEPALPPLRFNGPLNPNGERRRRITSAERRRRMVETSGERRAPEADG